MIGVNVTRPRGQLSFPEPYPLEVDLQCFSSCAIMRFNFPFHARLRQREVPLRVIKQKCNENNVIMRLID